MAPYSATVKRRTRTVIKFTKVLQVLHKEDRCNRLTLRPFILHSYELDVEETKIEKVAQVRFIQQQANTQKRRSMDKITNNHYWRSLQQETQARCSCYRQTVSGEGIFKQYG